MMAFEESSQDQGTPQVVPADLNEFGDNAVRDWRSNTLNEADRRNKHMAHMMSSLGADSGSGEKVRRMRTNTHRVSISTDFIFIDTSFSRRGRAATIKKKTLVETTKAN